MIIRFEHVSVEDLAAVRSFLASPENVLHPCEITEKRIMRKPYLQNDFRDANLPEQMVFSKELRSRKKPEITLELREDFMPDGCNALIHHFDTPRVYLRRLLKAVGNHRRALIKCRMSPLWWDFAVSKLRNGPTISRENLKGPFTNFDVSGGVSYARFLKVDFRQSRGCDCIIEVQSAVREGWLAECDYDDGDWHYAPMTFMYQLMKILNKFVPDSHVS